MKNITLIIGIALLSLNLAVCLLFDSISTKTTIMTCLVIGVSSLLSHISSLLQYQDAYKISLPWTFFTIGAIQYVCAFLFKSCAKEIGALIILILFAFELLLSVISYIISKRTMDFDNE